jgi:hypothetical protein
VIGPLATGLSATHARGDGGRVQLLEQHGDYEIAVFAAPNPPRAGPVDISVLVQDVGSKEPVTNADVAVTLTAVRPSGTTITAVATRDAATNKLLQSAIVELPHEGEWQVRVSTAVGGREIESRFEFEAGPAMTGWLAQWAWFGWPVLVVALFGVHRYRVARARRSRLLCLRGP